MIHHPAVRVILHAVAAAAIFFLFAAVAAFAVAERLF